MAGNVVCAGQTYRHYKGGVYCVLHIAKNSENLEEMVVYQNTADLGQIWVRPLAMFMETIDFSGKKMPRFLLIK